MNSGGGYGTGVGCGACGLQRGADAQQPHHQAVADGILRSEVGVEDAAGAVQLRPG